MASDVITLSNNKSQEKSDRNKSEIFGKEISFQP